jgi:hypothetical protein
MTNAMPKMPRGSFRVPNSIVQGLTTATPADLNRLTAFQTITLFGLMAHVPPKHPEKEVQIKVHDILEIIRVSRNVTHAIDRQWTTSDGEEHRRRYKASRYSPKHLQKVHAALLTLYEQSVSIHHTDRRTGRTLKDRLVHILDSFGYCYELAGQALDVDDLPPDRERVNITTDDRPVWRVRRRAESGSYFERPTAVHFRINGELAQEIRRCKGTIGFTLFAQRVFGLFREFVTSPPAVRLLVLTLRQTEGEFRRVLSRLLTDLGWDETHPTRAFAQLTGVLERLRDLGIVTTFGIDREADRVVVTINREWFRETGGP